MAQLNYLSYFPAAANVLRLLSSSTSMTSSTLMFESKILQPPVIGFSTHAIMYKATYWWCSAPKKTESGVKLQQKNSFHQNFQTLKSHTKTRISNIYTGSGSTFILRKRKYVKLESTIPCWCQDLTLDISIFSWEQTEFQFKEEGIICHSDSLPALLSITAQANISLIVWHKNDQGYN